MFGYYGFEYSGNFYTFRFVLKFTDISRIVITVMLLQC